MDVSYSCHQNSNVEEFCVAWRKNLKRVWGLPFQNHGVLLPRLSQCHPVLNEICRHSLKIVPQVNSGLGCGFCSLPLLTLQQLARCFTVKRNQNEMTIGDFTFSELTFGEGAFDELTSGGTL